MLVIISGLEVFENDTNNFNNDMTKYGLCIFLFLVCEFSNVNAQDCSPTLLELYNFGIGSVFQYKHKNESFVFGFS
jgi:hypothetical protein